MTEELVSPCAPHPPSAGSLSFQKPRVLVAMSGGVDSSVAAARLVAQGYEVVGVTLHLWDYPDDGSVRGRCCAPEDQYDARRTADHLGIPHYAFDRRTEFAREVVEPFVDAYANGETPSPCVECNRGVKMRELFALADHLGVTHVATGHYARILRDEGADQVWLAAASDPAKDQSYFLHALAPEQLRRLIFPLGEATKADVRREAHELGLPGAHKGESQELCFVPHGRYDAFVQARAADGKLRPGPILDTSGREVGRHQGVHNFTVGQRKGLGVALGSAAFVVRIDAPSAAVHLGSAEDLNVLELIGHNARFAPQAPREGEARIKVRARHEGALGHMTRLDDGTVRIRFATPVRAVSVGQYAVAYSGERVLGGARIAQVHRAHDLP